MRTRLQRRGGAFQGLELRAEAVEELSALVDAVLQTLSLRLRLFFFRGWVGGLFFRAVSDERRDATRDV